MKQRENSAPATSSFPLDFMAPGRSSHGSRGRGRGNARCLLRPFSSYKSGSGIRKCAPFVRLIRKAASDKNKSAKAKRKERKDNKVREKEEREREKNRNLIEFYMLLVSYSLPSLPPPHAYALNTARFSLIFISHSLHRPSLSHSFVWCPCLVGLRWFIGQCAVLFGARLSNAFNCLSARLSNCPSVRLRPSYPTCSTFPPVQHINNNNCCCHRT